VAKRTDDAGNAHGIRDEWSGSSTALIILAAGASRRMGRPKLLLPYGSRTFVRHAAETAVASICRPILVVLGAYANQLEKEIDDLPVRSVMNERWADGIGSSIQAGVTTLNGCDRAESIDALVLMLCDQPYVTPAVINDLVMAYHLNGKGIVASEYNDTLGVPALFGREYFVELATICGAVGAKQIIAEHASDVVPVPFPRGMTDIDTPEDYRKLQSAMLSHSL